MVKTAKYAIIIENAGSNFSAYSPNILGCVVTGKTVKETIRDMKKAIEFHFEGMVEDGVAIPKPATIVDEVELLAPTDIVIAVDVVVPTLAIFMISS